jgi:hypothetical protein
MRRIYTHTIGKEPFEDAVKAGRWNPCLRITFKDRAGKHTHDLSAGHYDVLDVYREGTETYVLSTNTRLGYVGLEVFNGDERAGEIFLQGDQAKEVLGRENIAPWSVIKRLRDYL